MEVKPMENEICKECQGRDLAFDEMHNEDVCQDCGTVYPRGGELGPDASVDENAHHSVDRRTRASPNRHLGSRIDRADLRRGLNAKQQRAARPLMRENSRAAPRKKRIDEIEEKFRDMGLSEGEISQLLPMLSAGFRHTPAEKADPALRERLGPLPRNQLRNLATRFRNRPNYATEVSALAVIHASQKRRLFGTERNVRRLVDEMKVDQNDVLELSRNLVSRIERLQLAGEMSSVPLDHNGEKLVDDKLDSHLRRLCDWLREEHPEQARAIIVALEARLAIAKPLMEDDGPFCNIQPDMLLLVLAKLTLQEFDIRRGMAKMAALYGRRMASVNQRISRDQSTLERFGLI